MCGEIETLKSVTSKLPQRSQEFAQSLIDQFYIRGDLSPKQWPWVTKLIEQANQQSKPKIEIGDLSRIIALFDTAGKHLKHPAIVLQVNGIDQNIRLSVAGTSARVPGSINVATAAPFGESQWFGRITRDGIFTPSREATPPALVPALQRFACDPAGEAAIHGHETGSCCFCNRELTDKRSVNVGYGPICAGHYGLPWG